MKEHEVLNIARQEHGPEAEVRYSARGHVWVVEVDGELVDEYEFLPEGEEERVRY